MFISTGYSSNAWSKQPSSCSPRAAPFVTISSCEIMVIFVRMQPHMEAAAAALSLSLQTLQPHEQKLPILSLSLFLFFSVRADPTPPFYIWPPCVSPETEGKVNKGLLQRERAGFGKKTLCKLKSCSQMKLRKWRGQW